MRETEITVQVFDDFKTIDSVLKNQGFEMIEEYQLNDWYFTKLDDIYKISYKELLKNSIVLRQIITDKERCQICYKNKQIDELGNVISEEKTVAKIEDIETVIKIFELANFNNWCNLKNHMNVYKKDTIQFAVQNIENLGIFIEYEEDETMKDMTANQKIETMKNSLLSLGLSLGNDYSCKKNYMMYLKNRG